MFAEYRPSLSCCSAVDLDGSNNYGNFGILNNDRDCGDSVDRIFLIECN